MKSYINKTKTMWLQTAAVSDDVVDLWHNDDDISTDD